MKWEDLRRSNNIEDLRGESQSRNTRGGLNITVPIIRFLI
jgi:predicted metalloprotease